MANGTLQGDSTTTDLIGRMIWSSVPNTKRNESSFAYTLQVRRPAYYTWGDWNWTADFYFSVGGANRDNYGTKNINVTTDWTTITSGSFTVPHSDNGAGGISLNITIFAPSGTSQEGETIRWYQDIELDTIHRNATITSAPNFNDEENPTISYVNHNGNSVEELVAGITDEEGMVFYARYRNIPKTGSTYTFSLTDDERKALRDAVTSGSSKTVKFYVRTTLDGVNYFSSVSKTLTLINHTPLISPEVVDTNADTVALTNNPNRLIKYYSDVNVSIGATARKGATITSQSVTNGGRSIRTATGTIEDVEDGSFVFSVVDSRGNSNRTTITRDLVDYIKLTCNLGINNPALDGIVGININGKYFNGSFGAVNNTLSLSFRYKENNGEFSNWIEAAVTPSENNYSLDFEYTIPEFNYRSSYVFQAKAVDKLSSIESTEITVITVPLFDWGESDFNFNIPVSIQGNIITDFVVEQGDDGAYAYRKWNSGLMEAWRISQSTVSASATTAYGSMYYADNLSVSTTGYASGFSSVLNVQLTVNKNRANGLWYSVVKGWDVSGGQVEVHYSLVNPTSLTANISPCVYIIGRWK